MWKIDHRHLRRLLFRPDICWLLWILPLIVHCVHNIGPTGAGDGGGGGGDLWPMDRPDGMPSIQSLEVMCGKDHMDVHLSFSQPFEGIVSSKGQHGDPRCIYVHPSSGRTYFSFRIAYARCGTKPDLHGQFYENTVVVQYDKDLLEVWDEAKRLRCEWFNDYEKTASKPPMVIADLDVIQLDFRGDNVDCWMEIQHGKGPWAPPVSGIVPLGSTLTLVVAINDYRGEFDMRVKSCVASDGGGHVIQLSDEFGCVLRPKMISRFLKAKGADERASVITYAFFHAFKFPDALSVHIKCKVEICRHGCLDHCQLQPHRSDIDVEISHYLSNEANGPSHIDRQDNDVQESQPSSSKTANSLTPVSESSEDLYDEIRQSDDSEERVPISSHNKEMYPGKDKKPLPVKGERFDDGLDQSKDQDAEEDENLPSFNEALAALLPQQDALTLNQNQNHESVISGAEPSRISNQFDSQAQQDQLFPHGPRYFEQLQQENEESAAAAGGGASIGGPRSFPDDTPTVMRSTVHAVKDEHNVGNGNRSKVERRKRSVVVSDRRARSTDVGVSGLYEVISEADLAFSPDSRAEAVTVFQGKIREEVVYGICMPVPGFSVLFIMVAISAVISALVAGSLLYRYQLQKEHMAVVQREHSTSSASATGAMPMSALVNWVGVHLMRMRASYPTQSQSATALNSDICETSVDSAVSVGSQQVNGKANGQLLNATNCAES